MRKVFPYAGYDTFEFDVPTRQHGDVYDRYLVRVEEIRQSVRICQQAIDRISPTGEYQVNDPRVVPPPKDKVYTEMEALIQHFLIYSQGFTVPKGEAYVPIEGPRGEHGVYVVSDGSNRPARVHLRPRPSTRARQCRRWSSAGSLRTSLPSSARPTSSWETWTGEFSSDDAV